MQIFKFWGYMGKFQFFLIIPYKECKCHHNAPFKPLTTIIGPTGGPLAMLIKPKKPENLKNRRLTMTTSLIADTPPLGQLIQIFAYGVIDLINCANFVENRFRGSGAGRR